MEDALPTVQSRHKLKKTDVNNRLPPVSVKRGFMRTKIDFCKIVSVHLKIKTACLILNFIKFQTVFYLHIKGEKAHTSIM